MTKDLGVRCTQIVMQPKNELGEHESPQVRKQLTIDEIKTFKGLENLTDEQAQETINTLVEYSTIIYAIYNSKILKNEKSFDEV